MAGPISRLPSANSILCCFGANTDRTNTHRTIYVKPEYLVTAAKRKYGRDIVVLGAERSSLDIFWNTLDSKAHDFNENDFPRQVTRTIVDITAKEHCNYGDNEDKITIETSEEEMQRQKKSYILSSGKESGWEFRGNMKVDAAFFNVASASAGLGGSRSRSKSKNEGRSQEDEASLSKSYGVSGEINVPPKTKVTATITTYAVTYKLNVKAIFSVPVSSYIDVHYKKPLCGCFGAVFTRVCMLKQNGYITAQELFQDENEFQVISGSQVQFTKELELSYLSETAEMRKEEKPL